MKNKKNGNPRQKNNNEFVFLPLGGVGEIGMNLAVYGYGSAESREWLIVDMGVSFAGADLPGADLILPDIRFLENERHNIRGLVLTHGHEDHYGAVLDLWPRLRVPVYCTPFTAGLLETKRETDFSDSEIPLHIFKSGDKFELGAFAVEAIEVSHSIPDSVSLVIETPLGRVVHTGDWKIDEEPSLGGKTDESRFRSLGEKGVLALICDSTNAAADSPALSEMEVGKNLEKIIADAKGCVAVTGFASNVGRLKSIALAAARTGRRVLPVGRSMKRCLSIAAELGYMEGVPPFLTEEDYAETPRNELVLLLTGSQGERRAALSKIARDEMRDITLIAGDILIYSSRSIPGNERAVIDTQNLLIDRGIKVITDHDAGVHVSGHPYQSQLRQMYEWVRPEILVPVHGEALHLSAHAEFVLQSGIKYVRPVRNGDMLRLAPQPPEIIDEVPVGRIYKDGNLLGTEEELGIKERRKLSYAGYVAVSFLLDKHYELADTPELSAVGLPETDSQGVITEDRLLEAIEDVIDNLPPKRRRDTETVREAVYKTIRSVVYNIWGKKPLTKVFVHKQ